MKHTIMKTNGAKLFLYSIILWTFLASAASAQPIKHQITGLFAPEREQDLREAFAKIADIKLVSIDFKNAEATLDYDAATVFPKMKPDQLLQKLDVENRTELARKATREGWL